MKEIVDRLEKLERRVSQLEARVVTSSSTNTIVLDKEMDRVIREIDTIESTYSGHQTWRPHDRERHKALRARLREIKTILNVKY